MHSPNPESRPCSSRKAYLPLLTLTALLLSPTPAATGNPAPACRPLLDGATAWFPGEDARNVFGGESGTLIGDAKIAPGRWGNAFQFDGVNDTVSVPGTAGLDLQDLTVECWLRRASTTRVGNDGSAVLMGGNGGAWVFAINAEGGLYLGKVGAANSPAQGAVVDDQWHHVAVTRQGTQLWFYVDGLPAGDASFPEPFGPSDSYGIGGLSRPFDNITYGFQGLIDDLTVYRRALTPAEITAVADRSAAPRCLDDVQLVVVTSPDRVIQGTEFAILTEVRNWSSRTAGPLRIRQNQLAGLEFVDAQLSQGAVSVSGQEVVANLGDLPPGATASVTFRWRMGTQLSGWINHRVWLDTTPEDRIAGNNEAQVRYLAIGQCLTTFPGLRFWWRGERSTEETLSGIVGNAGSTLGYTQGVVGEAFSLRENQAVLTQPQETPLQLADFAIECWVRRANTQAVSPTGNHCFIVAAPQAATAFGIVPDGRLYLYSQPTESVFSTATIADTAWHHVAVTRVGSDVRFYVDGVAAGAALYPATFSPWEYLTLGGAAGVDPGNTYSFLGDLDEVAIYSRGLSPAEVSAIAGAGGAGRCNDDLRLTVTAAPTQVVVNDSFEASFRVEQTGTVPADGVRFLTVLPPGVDFVSGTSDQGLVSEAAGVVRCDLGTVLPGTSARITLRLRPRAIREYQFDARVQSLSPELTEGNNLVALRVGAVDFQMSVDSLVVDEGSPGTTNRVAFRVHFNVARTEPVRLSYTTEDSTAAAGNDYLPASGERVVPARETEMEIEAFVLGDGAYERDEEFRLRIADLDADQPRTASGGAVIRNDDQPPLLEVLPGRWIEGRQGSQAVFFEVQLTGDTELPVRFRYYLENGTARAGTDFAAGSGNIEMLPNEGRTRIPVTLFGDTVFEGEELFRLRLVDAEACRVAAESVRGLIADDDPPSGIPARFSVTPANAPLEPGRPFPMVVTALDALGEVLTGFDGTLSITARRGSGIPSRLVISEVLAASRGSSDFVELLNASPAPVDLAGWRALLFGPATWPEPTVTLTLRPPLVLEPGRTLVLNDFFAPVSPAFDADVLSQVLWTGDAAGSFLGGPLVAVALQDPTGVTEDLFLAGRASPEFLQAILGPSGVRWTGPTVPPAQEAPYAFQRVGNRNSRTAEDWAVGLPANPGNIGILLEPRFTDAIAVVMSPEVLSGFSGGRWTGEVVLPDPAAGVAFFVDDGNGHTGRSDFLSSTSDLDQDGLPDAWEIESGLSYRDPKDAAADADGDSYTALQEWVAGTDPRNRSSALRLSILGNRLEWMAAAGRRYRLEQQEMEAGGAWTLLKQWEAGPGGPISEEPGAEAIAEGRLFRLRVELP